MFLKISIFEVVVVVERATRPQKDCAKTKRKWHRPWCGDDTCTLSWGVGMHQAIVWVKAADHHVASIITFSSAIRFIFLTQTVSSK
jgi:hypothetical protein